MSCRRAFDVDLVACLLDHGRPEWEAFRDHYPTCPDCAAEVRAWTELQAELTPAHPAPDRLLRFDEQPATLPADERHAIHDHVVTCAACRDELHMLRTTDLPALVRAGTAVAAPLPAAPGPPPPRPRRARPSFGARLRAVVWHPAFAYGVAVVLGIPTIARFGLEGDRARVEHASSPAPLDVASRERRDALFDAGEAPVDTSDASVDAREAPARPAASEAPARPAAPEARAMRGLAPAPGEIQHLAGASRFRTAGAEPGQASTPDVAADMARPPWPRIEMTPMSTHLVTAAVPGLVLDLPLPPDAATAGPAEIRIRDEAGRRELRQRVVDRSTHRVALLVPGEWLVPGHYVVELHLSDDEVAASATLVVADPGGR